MTCGSPTPRRWSAAVPGRPPSGRIWPASPSTGTAHRTAATSGGLRLHLLCTLHGLPIAAAVTGAKADERQVLLGMLDDADLTHQIPGTTLIADKNYYGREFETTLTGAGITLLRPTRKGEKTRPGGQFFKPLRQNVESVFDTFKGQLDLELHGGRTPAGVLTRIWQRVLALTAVAWHNEATGQRVKRSLVAYDH